MHRALFDDYDKNKEKLNPVSEPFSISRNLVQRKHETFGGNNIENKAFDVKSKLEKDEIDSISLASSSSTERFNHFITANDSIKTKFANKTEKLNNHEDDGAQSFSDFFKSIFKCSTGSAGNKKINEQIESDYPLNLHLRMNEIFSVHDKLSDVAENLNDLYSAGKFSLHFYIQGEICR